MEKKNIRCLTCGKEKATYCCRGCERDFCFAHLSEHRQMSKEQLHGIIDDHNLFKHSINEQKRSLANSALIEQIDRWERTAIKTIEQTAENCRDTVMESNNGLFADIHEQLRQLTEQIRRLDDDHDFNECDLNRMKTALMAIKRQWTGPSKSFVQYHSQDFLHKIDVVSVRKLKSAKWKQDANIVAGGNEDGQQLNQLYGPSGICVDPNKNILIADLANHRVVQWNLQTESGTVIAGGNGEGERMDQLNEPTDVLVDKRNQSIIIADSGNRRVVRCFDRNGTRPQVLIDDIDCVALAMDTDGFLYVSDREQHVVRRWKEGERQSTVVAGGSEQGDELNQLDNPSFLFVDEEQALFVSDDENHRVIKWRRGANEGVIVAGGNGEGDELNQLSHPRGVLVDRWGRIYVADYGNGRVVRWCEGRSEGEIVVGGNGEGQESNQLSDPIGLSFDDDGNLYVADSSNHRIAKFDVVWT